MLKKAIKIIKPTKIKKLFSKIHKNPNSTKSKKLRARLKKLRIRKAKVEKRKRKRRRKTNTKNWMDFKKTKILPLNL